MSVQAPMGIAGGERPQARSLAELEARVAYELDCLAYPDARWVPALRASDGRRVHAAVVVGAGPGGSRSGSYCSAKA